MKKTIIMVLVTASLVIYGCKDKQQTPQTAGPQAPVAAQQAKTEAPESKAAPGGDPHAGMKLEEVKTGATHKGKVLSTMNAAGYTYIEVEENGQKLWVAVMETTVKAGDTVEFSDSPPMENFQSKTLNRTFDKIILAPGIKINGK